MSDDVNTKHDATPGAEGNAESAASASAAAYTIRNHADYMMRLLSQQSIDSVITVRALIGQAPIADERFGLLIRNFIRSHPSMGLRVGDLDREVSVLRRAERASMRAAAMSVASSPADTETNLYRWIDECLSSWGVRVLANGNVQHPDFTGAGALNALRVLNSDRPSQIAFSDTALKAGLERVVSNRRLDRLDEIRRYISRDALDRDDDDVLFDLADVLRSGLAADCPYTPEQAVRLLAKSVWQVKRKMLGLPVTRHTMLVLVGPQGGGKSKLLESITVPLEELVVSVDLRTVTDERVFGLFDSYIGIVDELDKADRTSVESLKRIITERFMDRRVMGTNTTVKVPQNLTFFGSSNRDVGEAIVDETGNRRFVSIPVIGPTDPNIKRFWELVNRFQWIDLWRVVDPHGADPTADMLPIIQTTQATERSLSNIELWLEHSKPHPGAVVWDEWSATTRLYSAYQLWEATYAPRADVSYGWWTKAIARMARQGLIPFRAKATNARNGYIYIGGPGWPAPNPAKARKGEIPEDNYVM